MAATIRTMLDDERDFFLSLAISGAKTNISLVDESYFHSDVAKETYARIKNHVITYKSVPSARTMISDFSVESGDTPTEQPAYYAEKLRRRSVFRVATEKMTSLRDCLEDRDIPRIEDLVAEFYIDVGALRECGLGSVVDALAAYEEMIGHIGGVRVHAESAQGVVTGFGCTVDELSCGWQPGDLITLVAKIRTGKSTLLLNSVEAAHDSGRRCLFVSMEMPRMQVIRRLEGKRLGINPNLLKNGRLSTHVWDELRARPETPGTADFLRNLFIMENTRRLTVDDIRQAAYRCEPNAIYIDSAYLLQPENRRRGSDSRRETISDVFQEMKTLAGELHVPVINTTQFNRTLQDKFYTGRRRRRGESDDAGSYIEQRERNLDELSLDKIAETDAIGQLSSIVIGAHVGASGFAQTRRDLRFIKGRDGESLDWTIRFSFDPPDFSVIPDEELRGSLSNEQTSLDGIL